MTSPYGAPSVWLGIEPWSWQEWQLRSDNTGALANSAKKCRKGTRKGLLKGPHAAMLATAEVPSQASGNR
eukprot:CAMPEP_0204088978 /NCGR_PEP_ID=MMETSP0360-20130528/187039_1 /ASSEMBLY_ACC=CAM_ASM_000342 /TAXON_ID=268821 /ORGANISM="Scrippsiella Hangoei, Strain SHTV-5" /LENGTH=69 /DNA_ID=CAMNT_0051038177 /DNA_START=354 /DNA_END=561 /DNA_ORIENTATION=-